MSGIFFELVAHFGTQQRTAQALSVDQSTVSGWCRGCWSMSAATALRAEKVTGGLFSRKALCPGFPWDSFIPAAGDHGVKDSRDPSDSVGER